MRVQELILLLRKMDLEKQVVILASSQESGAHEVGTVIEYEDSVAIDLGKEVND